MNQQRVYELVRERQDRYSDTAEENQPPQSKLSHMHDDNIIHCPLVQSPNRSSNRMEVSYVHPITESPFQGADDNEKRYSWM